MVVLAHLKLVLDFVLMNAAVLLVVIGAVPDYKASVVLVWKAIMSGDVEWVLVVFVEETRAGVEGVEVVEGALL